MPFDLGSVGAGRAGQRQIEQKQVIELAVQKALLKKPGLVVQVRQSAAQQGDESALS